MKELKLAISDCIYFLGYEKFRSREEFYDRIFLCESLQNSLNRRNLTSEEVKILEKHWVMEK